MSNLTDIRQRRFSQGASTSAPFEGAIADAIGREFQARDVPRAVETRQPEGAPKVEGSEGEGVSAVVLPAPRADDTAGFLNRLYGGDNIHPKTLVVIEKGKPARHYWHRDIGEMAEHALELDGGAGNVYHSCAVFVESGELYKGRTQANALGSYAFWQDVDIGKGDASHADTAQARRALVAACDRARIPHPSIVSSGNGLHLYWFAGRLIPKDEWKRIACNLRKALQVGGLKIDTSRSEDLASILRPPGTHNRKGLVQEVA